MRGRYEPEISGSLDYGLGPPLNTFEAINLGGDGLTPLVPFKDADRLRGQGHAGGEGRHQKRLTLGRNCGRYPSCGECQETDCNWEPGIKMGR